MSVTLPYFSGASANSTVLLWSPTGRQAAVGSTAPNVSQYSARTATDTFIRGFRESVEIQTNSQLPWTWRRIVFAAKGIFQTASASDVPVFAYSPIYQGANTYFRPVIPLQTAGGSTGFRQHFVGHYYSAF